MGIFYDVHIIFMYLFISPNWMGYSDDIWMRLKHGVFGTKEAIWMGKMDIHQWIVGVAGCSAVGTSRHGNSHGIVVVNGPWSSHHHTWLIFFEVCIWRFHKWGYTRNTGWFTMENPKIKWIQWMMTGGTPMTLETSIFTHGDSPSSVY